jgi:hypothetical protein
MMKKLPMLVMSFAVFAMATGLVADEKKKEATPVSKKASAKAKAAASASSATVDAIMETAVRNIGRRYNLNAAQLEKTHVLMKREVYKFLQDHEDNVWPLIRDLLKAQLGNNPPENAEDVMRIGKGAGPLAKLAEQAIVRANEEWRNYLTAEQKVIHDYDMKEMRKTFKSINDNFDRWAEGKPSGESIFPAPQAATAGPGRPVRPPAGLPDPAIETIGETDMFFVAYVNEFIKKYELDPGQVNAARSILAEMKDQVAKFRATNYEALASITQELLAAQKTRDRKKIAEVETRRRKLLKQVYVLFGEMDGRLHGLLQEGQRERFAEKEAANNADKPTVKPAPKKTAPKNDADNGEATAKSAGNAKKAGGTQSAAGPTGDDG